MGYGLSLKRAGAEFCRAIEPTTAAGRFGRRGQPAGESQTGNFFPGWGRTTAPPRCYTASKKALSSDSRDLLSAARTTTTGSNHRNRDSFAPPPLVDCTDDRSRVAKVCNKEGKTGTQEDREPECMFRDAREAGGRAAGRARCRARESQRRGLTCPSCPCRRRTSSAGYDWDAADEKVRASGKERNKAPKKSKNAPAAPQRSCSGSRPSRRSEQTPRGFRPGPPIDEKLTVQSAFCLSLP